jgi:hypothetical protein
MSPTSRTLYCCLVIFIQDPEVAFVNLELSSKAAAKSKVVMAEAQK